VDANPAAVAMLGLWGQDVIGRNMRMLLPQAAGLIDGHLPGASVQGEVAVEAGTVGRPSGDDAMHLAVQLTSLTDRHGAQTGRLLVLRDVTERTATERRLRELLDAETHLASVLQTSLRPSSLPFVPGMHLAARSVPAGERTQVSGDFYDVHQALGGDWAFVLGDVAGKGVHAAVVTSMARYTVRTLSAQGWSPKQVLEQLNQALLVEAEPERFCTVVYARLGELDPVADDEEPPHGVRVTVSLGGHPAPMVRRVDGTVETVGRPGTALGIVSLVDVEEVRTDLYPGDVLLAYTDGVTEARRDGEEFGELRLAQTLSSAAAALRGRTGQGAAALVADAVADKIVETVTAFASHRDDVAVLVLAVS
jgi:sigma-B regulation protein RsbU (phosphoserine phosphatase)